MSTTSETLQKQIQILVLDSGPLLNNEPPISTLIAKATKLITVPAVLPEIRDPVARARFETTVKPFLDVRDPRPESLSFVSGFAKKTGDREVLSEADLKVLALAYECELERNGGDWRLRKEPGQKGLNGAPPPKNEESIEKPIPLVESEQESVAELATATEAVSLEESPPRQDIIHTKEEDEEDSDSEGWITPSNIKKHQAKEAAESSTSKEPQTYQVAMLTTDYAMQNVALQINLNLLSTSLQRIRQVKTWILRCHACFKTTRDTSKQFCPSCGGATLMRASCSTDERGQFKIHLKKNMQWNNRGNVFSVPKPIAGSANGKIQNGGGQDGWGQKLILREDQKEYVRAMAENKRKKERNLMDRDYLPDILTGERHDGGKIKVGAGRNVNSRKRH